MNSIKMNNVKNNNKLELSNTKSKTNIFKYLFFLIGIILIIFIIYVAISYYNYSKVSCYEKKSFSDYLFSNDSNICILFDKPIPKVVPKPVFTINKDNVPKDGNLLQKDEVFHINNQDYTYDQSKCKCAAYGARLATKNEITDAYNKGANWCTYGWSEGQNAFYPTQKCFYDALLREEQYEEEEFLFNSENYCGKPGINGGYFSDPQIKFGINCYGKKPKGSVIVEKKPYCSPKNFCKLPKNSYSNQKLSTDEISPFNNLQWNN